MSMSDKLNILKENSGLTLEQISDKSNIPLGTVKRIFAGHTENPNILTVVDIVRALGGSLDDVLELVPRDSIAKEQKKETKSASDLYNEDLILLYKKMIVDKNRWIYILFGLLAIILTVTFIILIYDLFNPNMGYIKY